MAHRIDDCCSIVLGGHPPDGPAPAEAVGLEQYHSAQDDSIFLTTSTVFVSTGKQLVTPVLPAGNYRLGCWVQMGEPNLGTFSDPEYNVDLDGGGFVWPTTARMFADTTADFWPWYRSRLLPLAAGAHTFTLQLRSRTAGNNARMGVSLLELWREPPSLAGDPVDPCAENRQDIITNFTTAVRFPTGRVLATPNVNAGRYRIRCDWIFERHSGGSTLWNLALDGADMLATYCRERPFANRLTARTFCLETNLAAGLHTFELIASAIVSTSFCIGESCFYMHQVP